MIKKCLWLLVMVFTLSGTASAQDFVHLRKVILCEASPTGAAPTFREAGCKETDLYRVDPQGRDLWAKASVTLPLSLVDSDRPLGLFISGKVSSAFFVNGVLIGQNGTPAAIRSEEVPGRIDAVFHVPQSLVQVGPNEITFRMSGHHGYLQIASPLHIVTIGPYITPTDYTLHRYLPSFLPLGILIIGTLYFGFLAFRHRNRKSLFLLPLASLFATGQLMSELSRGLVSYSYPLHDIRVTVILVCAFGVGVCLLLHVLHRFARPIRPDMLLGGLGLMLIPVYFLPTFDDKAAFAILTPTALGAIIALNAARRDMAGALAYAAILSVSAAAIYLTTSDFLDVYFYYFIAGLLVFLFFGQVSELANAKRQRAEEQARADRLELALAEAEQKQAPSTLSVTSGGRVERVPTDQLIYCKGARDYVELVIDGSKSKLHSASLTELAEELPATFLRVHRSYIVNTGFIDRLERETSGSGTLHLTTGDSVPVSRRIMPTVRKALS